MQSYANPLAAAEELAREKFGDAHLSSKELRPWWRRQVKPIEAAAKAHQDFIRTVGMYERSLGELERSAHHLLQHSSTEFRQAIEQLATPTSSVNVRDTFYALFSRLVGLRLDNDSHASMLNIVQFRELDQSIATLVPRELLERFNACSISFAKVLERKWDLLVFGKEEEVLAERKAAIKEIIYGFGQAARRYSHQSLVNSVLKDAHADKKVTLRSSLFRFQLALWSLLDLNMDPQFGATGLKKSLQDLRAILTASHDEELQYRLNEIRENIATVELPPAQGKQKAFKQGAALSASLIEKSEELPNASAVQEKAAETGNTIIAPLIAEDSSDATPLNEVKKAQTKLSYTSHEITSLILTLREHGIEAMRAPAVARRLLERVSFNELFANYVELRSALSNSLSLNEEIATSFLSHTDLWASLADKDFGETINYLSQALYVAGALKACGNLPDALDPSAAAQAYCSRFSLKKTLQLLKEIEEQNSTNEVVAVAEKVELSLEERALEQLELFGNRIALSAAELRVTRGVLEQGFIRRGAIYTRSKAIPAEYIRDNASRWKDPKTGASLRSLAKGEVESALNLLRNLNAVTREGNVYGINAKLDQVSDSNLRSYLGYVWSQFPNRASGS